MALTRWFPQSRNRRKFLCVILCDLYVWNPGERKEKEREKKTGFVQISSELWKPISETQSETQTVHTSREKWKIPAFILQAPACRYKSAQNPPSACSSRLSSARFGGDEDTQKKELISSLVNEWWGFSAQLVSTFCLFLVKENLQTDTFQAPTFHLHGAHPLIQQSAAEPICFNCLHARACAAGWKETHKSYVAIKRHEERPE